MFVPLRFFVVVNLLRQQYVIFCVSKCPNVGLLRCMIWWFGWKYNCFQLSTSSCTIHVVTYLNLITPFQSFKRSIVAIWNVPFNLLFQQAWIRLANLMLLKIIPSQLIQSQCYDILRCLRNRRQTKRCPLLVCTRWKSASTFFQSLITAYLKRFSRRYIFATSLSNSKLVKLKRYPRIQIHHALNPDFFSLPS